MKLVDHEAVREEVGARMVVEARLGMAEAGTLVAAGLGRAWRLEEGTGQVEGHSQVALGNVGVLHMARRSLAEG